MKNKTGLLSAFISLIIGLGVGYLMYDKFEKDILWDYEPLFLWSSIWVFLLSLLYLKSKDKANYLKNEGLAFLFGSFMTLGFSPFSFPILIFIAWIPMFYLLDAKEKNTFHIFSGLLVWNILSTFWVTNTSLFSGLIANLANAGLMLIPLLIHQKINKFFAPKFKWLSLVTCWISFEYLHMQWDLSWPWLNIGNAFGMAVEWVQWYEWTGIFGGAVWIFVVNIWGYKLVKSTDYKSLWKPGLVILIPILISYSFPYFKEINTTESVNVVVAQTNYEPHYKRRNTSNTQKNREIFDLIQQGIDSTTDYLVLPEATFQRISLDDPLKNTGINILKRLSEQYPNLEIVTGVSGIKEFDTLPENETALRQFIKNNDTLNYVVYNAAISFGKGKDFEQYYKSKFVPGSEIFPFREFLWFMKPFVRSIGGTYEGHGSQAERSVFEGKAKVAPIICYESVYGDYLRGFIDNDADLFFVMTLDSWWAKTPGYRQHLGMSRLRAIEFRRSIARASNGGTSCFINSWGEVIQATEYEEMKTIKASLFLNHSQTVYAKTGDIIARISLLIFLLFLFNLIVKIVMKKRN